MSRKLVRKKADEGNLYLWFPVLFWVPLSNCRTELRGWWKLAWEGAGAVKESVECGDGLYSDTN